MTPTTLRALRAVGEHEHSIAYLATRPDLLATLVITFDGERVVCAAPSKAPVARPINPPSGETGD